MKSLSTIVTVSNFKTAARALLVLTTLTVSILTWFYSAPPANAAGPDARNGLADLLREDPVTAADKRYRDQCVNPKDGTIKASSECKALYLEARPKFAESCQKREDKIDEAAKKAEASCGKAGLDSGSGGFDRCFDRVNSCSDAEAAMQSNSDEDEDGPANDKGDEFCNRALANNCPAIPDFMDGRDYRQEEKDAEKDRRDTKKDVDDLLEDQQKLQADQIKQKQELNEQLENAARSRVRKSQEIIDNAKKDKENLSEATRKALEDASSIFNQMDAKYIELRDKARRASSNVRRTQDLLQATCRAAANANYSKAEAARIAAQKLGRRNVGSAANMAGASRRKAEKDVRARNADFVAFFNECVGGVSPEGRAALNAINKAADDLKDEEQLIADQSALIEKQRLDVIKKLKDLETSVPPKEQKIIETMNQDLKNLDEDYNLAIKRANEKAASMQQDASTKLMSIQNKLNSAQTEMQKSASEALLAKRRGTCLGKAGRRSESVRNKVAEGFRDAMGEIKTIDNLCKNMPDGCSKPSVCADATRAVLQKLDEKGKPRKPRKFEVEPIKK